MNKRRGILAGIRSCLKGQYKKFGPLVSDCFILHYFFFSLSFLYLVSSTRFKVFSFCISYPLVVTIVSTVIIVASNVIAFVTFKLIVNKGNLSRCVSAGVRVRGVVTRKSCPVGMHNAN